MKKTNSSGRLEATTGSRSRKHLENEINKKEQKRELQEWKYKDLRIASPSESSVKNTHKAEETHGMLLAKDS